MTRPARTGLQGRPAAVRLVAVTALAAAAWCAGALVPAPGAGAATAPCPAAPAGRVSVTVVIDDGSSVRIRCVEVGERATGGEALLAAATVRRDDPVKGPAFVCGIDGVPAVGCAAVGEPYWSYWSGSAGWNYQAVGAFGYRLPARCAVEGWRFGTGRSTPAIPVPATPCTSSPTTSVPSNVAPDVPPLPPVPAPAPAPAAPAGGATGAAGPVPGVAPAAVAGATTVPPSSPSPSPSSSSVSSSSPGAVPSGPDGPPGPRGAPAAGPGPADPAVAGVETPVTTGAGAARSRTDPPPAGPDEAAAATRSRARSDGAGPGWPVVVGLFAIAALGVAALVRSRGDRASSPVS